jgi:formate hydrogenlyase subunit 4
MMDLLLHLAITLLIPPFLLSVIARTKAWFAGRVGPHWLQPYFDLVKLLRKGSVISDTTTWVFRAGPTVGLASVATASLLLPLGNHPAPLSFTGDMILFAYLFGLARFFTMGAALDTGSSFEGMGAAREATFSCLAEPTLFLALMVIATVSGTLSLTPMLTGFSTETWMNAGAALLLLAGALFTVLLVENCRIPFDDPNTHLELTMIHEVMVLDHGGPAFGYITYAAALKLFILEAFFVQVLFPFRSGNSMLDWAIFIVALLVVTVAIGVVESVMARLKLLRIPQLQVAAMILSAFALLLITRRP